MAQFETETKDAVLQRMLNRISNDIDKRQGSVSFDLSSPAAIELAQAYIALDQVLTFGFASENMPSNYLDLRVGELGITRKPAGKAVGQVTFTGTEGLAIPKGTRISTDEVTPRYFRTTQAGTITNGSVTVNTEAEQGGASGNVLQGKVVLTLGNITGISSVTNSQAFDGGADEEGDASLLARYYDRVRKPATSGNANHYEQWAREIAGVGAAKIYPLANGNGTVKVVLLDENKTAPPQTTIDSVADYIEAVKPIGATVEVVAATETPINISATLTLANGMTLTDATNEFTELLDGYLKSLAFVDPIVRYSKIASLLVDAESVVDYADLTINGGELNVTVEDGAVAVVGTVTFV